MWPRNAASGWFPCRRSRSAPSDRGCCGLSISRENVFLEQMAQKVVQGTKPLQTSTPTYVTHFSAAGSLLEHKVASGVTTSLPQEEGPSRHRAHSRATLGVTSLLGGHSLMLMEDQQRLSAHPYDPTNCPAHPQNSPWSGRLPRSGDPSLWRSLHRDQEATCPRAQGPGRSRRGWRDSEMPWTPAAPGTHLTWAGLATRSAGGVTKPGEPGVHHDTDLLQDSLQRRITNTPLGKLRK